MMARIIPKSILNQLSFATGSCASPPSLCAIMVTRMAPKPVSMQPGGGDAVICMDGDLQHPPYLVPIPVNEWQKV